MKEDVFIPSELFIKGVCQADWKVLMAMSGRAKPSEVGVRVISRGQVGKYFYLRDLDDRKFCFQTRQVNRAIDNLLRDARIKMFQIGLLQAKKLTEIELIKLYKKLEQVSDDLLTAVADGLKELLTLTETPAYYIHLMTEGDVWQSLKPGSSVRGTLALDITPEDVKNQQVTLSQRGTLVIESRVEPHISYKFRARVYGYSTMERAYHESQRKIDIVIVQ